MELTLWQPSGVPTISWDYEVGFWEQARNYRGEVPWHIVLPVMISMLVETVLICYWACRAVYQLLACLWATARVLRYKPETRSIFTQCTELSFDSFDICITQSGRRYHTNRGAYVNNANQQGISYYAKCPSCASLDHQEMERAQRAAEEEELGPGLN